MQALENQMDLCDPLQVYKKISTIARVELVLFPAMLLGVGPAGWVGGSAAATWHVRSVR